MKRWMNKVIRQNSKGWVARKLDEGQARSAMNRAVGADVFGRQEDAIQRSGTGSRHEIILSMPSPETPMAPTNTPLR